MSAEHKCCSKCGEVKPLSAFPRRKSASDGYNSQCKECGRAYNASYRAANAERERQRVREYHAANRELEAARQRQRYWRKVRIRASQRRYYWRNRDRRLAQSSAWRTANREHLAAYYRDDARRRQQYKQEWRRSNPERIRSYRKQTAGHDFLTQWRRAHVQPGLREESQGSHGAVQAR